MNTRSNQSFEVKPRVHIIAGWYTSSSEHEAIPPTVRFKREGKELFVMACAPSWSKTPIRAAEQTAEATRWSYAHIGRRPFYTKDRRLFVKRITKTVHLNLLKEQSTDMDLESYMAFVMHSEQAAWISLVGSFSCYHIHPSLMITTLTKGTKAAILGGKKKLAPHAFARCLLGVDDSIIVVSALEDTRHIKELLTSVASVYTETDEELTDVVKRACIRFTENTMGSVSALVVRKIATERETLQIAY